MSDKINIAELKRNTDIVQVIGRYVDLKKDGIHFVGCCPFHEEKTSSFKVTPTKNIYKCFGCGAAGDVFDFLIAKGRTFPEALKEVSDPNNSAAVEHGGDKKRKSIKVAPTVVWRQIVPAPRMDGMYKHFRHGEPSMTWDYHDANGSLMGCICRFDLPKRKEVLPLIYATDGTRKEWRFQGFEKPRPLYDLHILEKNPTKSVLLVEGEKTAEAAKKLFPRTNVTAWQGGAQGTKYTDWKPLQGRTVIMWPDNDTPGFNAMHDIYDLIKGIAGEVKWVKNEPGTPKHWDLADSEWSAKEAKAHSAKNIIDYPGRSFEYSESTVPSASITDQEPQKTDEQIVSEVLADIQNQKSQSPTPPNENNPNGYTLIGSEHFRMLGAHKEGNGMIYYFYALGTKTVIGLSPSSMSKNNLMQLAPLTWWGNSFPDNKSVFSVDRAADYLINMSSRMGTFSDKWLRGRGAWMDGKNVVVHAGDKLFVNGKLTELSDYKSKYIYEIGEELGFTVDNPIGNVDAVKLIELLKLLNWDRPINPYILAGWCVVSPICGALNWRPHIWLTGGAGTGKTWIFKHIIRALLGETCLAVQGETSEAGLRQILGHDALPVVFDEAEGEDRKSQERMQSVVQLMRSSSAHDGGVLAKGSAGGSAKTYKIRSCFAFGSITVQVDRPSDKSRIHVLGLLKAIGEDKNQKWQDFLAKYNALITDRFCEGIRARTISLIPTILSNIKTFSNAAAAVIGEQRAGDQVGVLLAGAYSLFSDKVISYPDAVEWVQKRDWSEERSQTTTSDEVSLISHLLEYMVRVETQAATVERPIGELVLIAMGLISVEWNLSAGHANERLKRTGMRVVDDCLIISNSDANILKILQNTPWSKNHNKILMRIEGAEDIKNMRFASGISTRAVRIPKSVLFKDFVPEVIEKPVTPMDAAAKELAESTDPFETQEDLPF